MNILDYSIEDLAHALYLKMEQEGYTKGTDKTKWREPVVANILEHKAHDKISAGKDSERYGSDAYDERTGTFAEYKSQAISSKQVRNLLEKPKGKNGEKFAPLTVKGVYNGAYKQDAIEAYSKIDHYFGVFYQEKCLLVIKPNTDEVIRQLSEGLRKMQARKSSTTNCNSVSINLKDTHLYTVMHRDFTTIQGEV